MACDTTLDTYSVTLKFRDKLCGGIVEDIFAEPDRTRFKSDAEKGLFLDTRLLVASLRAWLFTTRGPERIRGLKRLLLEGLCVTSTNGEPTRLYLGRQKPEGCVEHSLTIRTPEGRKVTSTLHSDYVTSAVLSFRAHLLVTPGLPLIDRTWLQHALGFGRQEGIGNLRRHGHGRFEVVSVEQLEPISLEAFRNLFSMRS